MLILRNQNLLFILICIIALFSGCSISDIKNSFTDSDIQKTSKYSKDVQDIQGLRKFKEVFANWLQENEESRFGLLPL